MNRLFPISFVVICLLVFAASVQAAPPSPYTNIITNGDFSQYFSTWTLVTAGTPNWDVENGVLHIFGQDAITAITQTTTYSGSTGDKYDITLSLGNSSPVDKTFNVALDNAADGANRTQCSFTVPANTPLHDYRVQAVAPGAWAALRFLINSIPNDSQPSLLIDNITVVYVPGASFTSTTCGFPPTPTPTPTATPALALTWALPTRVINGTPQPAQYAQFSYGFSVGEAAVSILLFALLLLITGVFVVWILVGRNRRKV